MDFINSTPFIHYSGSRMTSTATPSLALQPPVTERLQSDYFFNEPCSPMSGSPADSGLSADESSASSPSQSPKHVNLSHHAPHHHKHATHHTSESHPHHQVDGVVPGSQSLASCSSGASGAHNATSSQSSYTSGASPAVVGGGAVDLRADSRSPLTDAKYDSDLQQMTDRSIGAVQTPSPGVTTVLLPSDSPASGKQFRIESCDSSSGAITDAQPTSSPDTEQQQDTDASNRRHSSLSLPTVNAKNVSSSPRANAVIAKLSALHSGDANGVKAPVDQQDLVPNIKRKLQEPIRSARPTQQPIFSPSHKQQRLSADWTSSMSSPPAQHSHITTVEQKTHLPIVTDSVESQWRHLTSPPSIIQSAPTTTEQSTRTLINEVKPQPVSVHVAQTPAVTTTTSAAPTDVPSTGTPLRGESEDHERRRKHRSHHTAHHTSHGARTAAHHRRRDESSEQHRRRRQIEAAVQASNNGAPIEYVGPFALGPVLGRGCTGVVRVGTHRHTGFRCAFKIITKSSLQSDAKLWRKVKREIAIMKLVEHPHVLKLYDVLETDEQLYLVTELLNGELFDYIVQRGRLDRNEALRMTAQILMGLEHCHAHSVVHRDLKPGQLTAVLYLSMLCECFTVSVCACNMR